MMVCGVDGQQGPCMNRFVPFPVCSSAPSAVLKLGRH